MIILKLSIITLISVTLGLITYYKDKVKHIGAIVGLISAIYVGVLLSITLIGREKLYTATAVLLPGYSYRHVLMYPWFVTTGDGVIACAANVLMFLPLGMAITLLFPSKHPYVYSGITAFFISFVIELTQYYTMLGSFEMDDIIHNTWGAVIGSSVVLVIIHKEKNKKTNAIRLMPVLVYAALFVIASILPVFSMLVR